MVTKEMIMVPKEFCLHQYHIGHSIINKSTVWCLAVNRYNT